MTSQRMTKREKLAWLADLEEGYRPFDKHALTLLRSLMDDTDAQVRAEAIACLWDDPDPRWIDVLMRKVENDPHAQVRAHAISALGRYVFEGQMADMDDWATPGFEISQKDYQRVIEFLLDIAHDGEEAIGARRYAIEALAFCAEEPAVIDLIDWAYQQKDRRFKVSAIFAMARHGDACWTSYILTELRSRDTQVQYEAVRAAGELGLHEATDTLIEFARNKTLRKPLRLLATFALGETGDERAMPVLEQLARSRDRDLREVAREAIEEWYAVLQMEEMADQAMDGMAPEGVEDYFDLDALPDIWDSSIGAFSRN